tara:strand:- start:5392 stop:6258 length:867 start_codon:yes stop_codon:yes gene_type:complete
MNFLTPSNAHFYRGGHTSVNFYNKYCAERREKYKYEIDQKYQKHIDEVNEKGYSKIQKFFDLEELNKFKFEIYDSFKNKTNTKFVQNNSHEQIVEPYLNTKYAFDMATDERIVNMASAFFNCLPALGTCNLRRSFPTSNQAAGTGMFHRDFNSPVKIFKFFIYLDDVKLENGPFTYVEGSNREMPANPHWSRYHRWPDNEIEKIYGKDRIKHLTADYGDLLMATTNGFHKGLKTQEGERIMFTINYLIHPEIEGGDIRTAKNRFFVKQTRVDSLPDWKKPVADFLIKV